MKKYLYSQLKIAKKSKNTQGASGYKSKIKNLYKRKMRRISKQEINNLGFNN